MARFDVYPNPNAKGYLLDVQTNLLSDLNTRMVVPLMPQNKAPQPAKRLNPVVEIKGQPHVMVTQFMAAVPAAMLKDTVGDLSESAEEITNALDMLFIGF